MKTIRLTKSQAAFVLSFPGDTFHFLPHTIRALNRIAKGDSKQELIDAIDWLNVNEIRKTYNH